MKSEFQREFLREVQGIRAELAAALGEAGDGPPPTRRQLMMLAEEMGLPAGAAAAYGLAVFLRWGRPAQPAPPAEGEVAELARWLDERGRMADRGGSFNGWRDPGAGSSKCDMPLYAHAHPTPPAEGEIDQLVSQLRDYAKANEEDGWEGDAALIRRAAELLPWLVEARDAFTSLRDEILHGLDGFDPDQTNAVLDVIDNHTPDWV